MIKLVLLSFLPIGTFAQDTLYVKGGTKYAVTITKVEDGLVYFNTGKGYSSIPESSLDWYHLTSKLAVPKKKDNIILIETSNSPLEAYTKMRSLLMDAGYPIEDGYSIKNTEIPSWVITTSEKPGTWTKDGFRMNVTIVHSGKTIIKLSGLINSIDSFMQGVYPNKNSLVYYSSSKSSPLAKAWTEMDKVARSYTKGIIS